MTSQETLLYELEGRLREADFGKRHVSLRWEPAPGVVRVGVMLDDYSWDRRMQTIAALLDFEKSHADEFALEFDIFALEDSLSDDFAEV